MGLLIGVSVVLVALTLCAAIAALSYRMWRADQGVASGGSSDTQMALLAGSIALFGVLISGIFLFTTFRIDEGAQRAASEAARERATAAAEEVVEGLQDQVSRLDNALALLTGKSSPQSASEFQVGTPVMVKLLAKESRSFEFSAPTFGTYSVEVEAVTPDFAPVLYLYEDGRIAGQDTGGGANARVSAPLSAGIHTIRIEDPAGRPGFCTILITFRSNRR